MSQESNVVPSVPPTEPDGAAGFELFRRAVCGRDQRAWEGLFLQYHRLVLTWVRQHPAWSGSGEDADYWTNRAFERFFLAVGPTRFASFPGLPQVLRYLKLCVYSVLMDAARASRANTVRWDDALPANPVVGDVADVALAELNGNALWQAIVAEVQDEAERIVAHDCFDGGLRPRQVYRCHPDRFASVADVYRVKRNLIGRLRRSPAIQQHVFRASPSPEIAEPVA